MKKHIFKAFAVITSVTLFALPALAQQVPVEGISFKLGDDVQTVKNALKTNLDPYEGSPI